MPEDRFEETKLTITSVVTKGDFAGEKPVNFKFVQTGGWKKIPDKQVMVSCGGTAKHEVTFPKVKDEENHAAVEYTCEFEAAVILQNDYRVWPKTLEIKATLEDTTKAEGFAFKINQNGKVSQRWLVGSDGTCSPTLERPTDAVIVPVSPWEFAAPVDNTKPPRKRELKVRKKPWKARIKNLTAGKSADKPLKAWVNLATDYAKLHGNILEVEVGPEDMSLAQKGQEIHARVTFPATNSMRNDPLTALQTGEDPATAVAATDGTAEPGKNDLVYETVVKIPNDRQKAVFYVNLGVAGGDKCKIEVGATKTYEDDVRHLENWRKIGIEMLVPELAIRQNCDHLLKSDGAALTDAVLTELKRSFENTFVEFEFPKDGCLTFGEADLTYFDKGNSKRRLRKTKFDRPDTLIVPAESLWDSTVDGSGKEKRRPLSKGAMVFIPTWHHLAYVRWQKRGRNNAPALEKNAMCFRWCDKIADRARQQRLHDPGGNDFWKDMFMVTNCHATNMKTSASKEIVLPFHVFERDPVIADGSTGIYSVTWRAHRYKKPSDARWTRVELTGPGSDYRDWQGDTIFHSVEEMQGWVEIKDSRHVKVKLPNDLENDPGNLQKIEDDGDEYLLDIQVKLRCRGVEFITGGGVRMGMGILMARGSTNGMADTLAHEIAHNFGQAYTKDYGSKEGIGDTYEIPGIPFGAQINDTPPGQYYLGRGHDGSHCAKHIVDYAKDKTNKDDILGVKDWTDPGDKLLDDFVEIYHKRSSQACIMFGAEDQDASYTLNFCDECKKHIRATDLSDVTKDWNP
jgi:hypothetical protein